MSETSGHYYYTSKAAEEVGRLFTQLTHRYQLRKSSEKSTKICD
jgi:hypothetical protein